MAAVLVRMGLVLASVSVGLVLLEAGVRVFGRPAPSAYTGRGLYAADDDLGHVLRPDRVSGDIRTSSRGFRDGEYAIARPAGAYRIVGIGDSFTFGSTFPKGIYLEVLEERLAARGWGFPVEVINTGVPCYSTVQEIGHLRKFGLAFQPDLVILGLFPTGDVGENHSNEHFEVVEGELVLDQAVGPWERRLRRFHLYRFIQRRLVVHAEAPRAHLPEQLFLETEAARLEVCQPQLRRHLSHGYRVTERLLLELRDELRPRGIDLLVLLIPDEVQVDPRLFDRVLALHGGRREDFDLDLPGKRLGDFMKKNGIDFVDPLAELRARVPVEPVYWPLDTHWNEAGCAIAAQALERAIAPRIEAHARRARPRD